MRCCSLRDGPRRSRRRLSGRPSVREPRKQPFHLLVDFLARFLASGKGSPFAITALVPGGREPCVFQHCLALCDKPQNLTAVRQGTENLIAAGEVLKISLTNAPVGKDLPGDDPVPGRGGG